MQLHSVQHEIVMPGPPEGRRVFEGLQGMREAAQGLEEAVMLQEPVTVDDLVFDDQRGIVFAATRKPITVASDSYHIRQNRELLLHVAERIEARGLQPYGYIDLSEFGHMSCKVFLANPEFEVHVALGSTMADDLITLGLAVENSYGRPRVSVATDSIGYAVNEQKLLYFPKTLGRVAFRHTRNKRSNVDKALSMLIQNAPAAGRRIQEAYAYRFKDADCVRLALRGIGFGPTLASSLFGAGAALTRSWTEPPSAWGLYQALAGYYKARNVNFARCADTLRIAENLLVTSRIDDYIKKGRSLEEREELLALEEYVLGHDSQQTLPISA